MAVADNRDVYGHASYVHACRGRKEKNICKMVWGRRQGVFAF
jgi:hypothetical protein